MARLKLVVDKFFLDLSTDNITHLVDQSNTAVRDLELKVAELEAENCTLKAELEQIEAKHKDAMHDLQNKLKCEMEEMKIKHANDKKAALDHVAEDFKEQLADQFKDFSKGQLQKLTSSRVEISVSPHQEHLPNQLKMDEKSNLTEPTEAKVKRNNCCECDSKSWFCETFAYCSSECKLKHL